MSIVVASMVRNEAGGYLESALDAWADFANEIVVLDDNSTDGTRELLESRGVRVFGREGPTAWGAESQPRQELWAAAVESGCDWIFVLDADMVPAKDPTPLTKGSHDGVLFLLYDLWSTDPLMFREDAFWNAHNVPRLWLVKNPTRNSGFVWSQRGIHCGHFPVNLSFQRTIRAPRDYAILHYGYAAEEDRSRKMAQYESQKHQLMLQEQLHAESIADSTPNLRPMDVDIRWQLSRKS